MSSTLIDTVQCCLIVGVSSQHDNYIHIGLELVAFRAFYLVEHTAPFEFAYRLAVQSRFDQFASDRQK